jgi:cytochrome c553
MTLLLAFAPAMQAADKVAGTDGKEPSWNTAIAEKIKALQAKANVKAGAEAYKAYCEACHLPSGAGDSRQASPQPAAQENASSHWWRSEHRSIPRLAGQHPNVLIKQLADIRSGLRYNPSMQPFARRLANEQEVANVVAYISTLCIPPDSEKYAGLDAADIVVGGRVLYEKECAQCHQPNGEGINEMFYPALAGQHYHYLLRQMTDIRYGKRGNSHPDMVRVIKKYNDQQLVSIAAYLANLNTPRVMPMTDGSLCETAAGEGSKPMK